MSSIVVDQAKCRHGAVNVVDDKWSRGVSKTFVNKIRGRTGFFTQDDSYGQITCNWTGSLNIFASRDKPCLHLGLQKSLRDPGRG